MSRKRFTTMIAVVLLLGAAGLISLYMTLGRMNAMLRSQGRPGAPASDATAEGGGKIEQLTPTPAGESQLRMEAEHARQERESAAAPPAPVPAPASKAPEAPKAPDASQAPPVPKKPGGAPSGASGSPGR